MGAKQYNAIFAFLGIIIDRITVEMIMQAKPKAIFYIQNGLGGAERVQIEIAKMLLSAGWDIDMCIVYNVSDSDTRRIESFFPAGVHVSRVCSTGQWKYLNSLRNSIKDSAPAVVFASAMHINQRLLLLSVLFPKVRFIVRNENYLYTISGLKRFSLRFTYRLADAIIAQTEEMEEELASIGCPRNRIHTLYNPLNTEQILKLSEETSPYSVDNNIKRFVAVGRVVPQKGFDILIDAFAEVAKVSPNSELYIVGETSFEMYNELLGKVSKLQLDGKIFFTGFQNNPYKYIKNADVFVLSSRYEGLPNTLIEAMLLKKPCVATKCIPIISRIISEGKNGYLVAVEDSTALAKAMTRALELHGIVSSYKPSSKEDFVHLFNTVVNIDKELR